MADRKGRLSVMYYPYGGTEESSLVAGLENITESQADEIREYLQSKYGTKEQKEAQA